MCVCVCVQVGRLLSGDPRIKKLSFLNIYVYVYVQVGRLLSGDPRIKKLSFTGSTAVGKLLMAQCATTVKRVSLGELKQKCKRLCIKRKLLKDAVHSNSQEGCPKMGLGKCMH